jgi:hypothetical protein
MDNLTDLAQELRTGRRVKLCLGQEPDANVVQSVFDRLQQEHELTVESVTCLSGNAIYLIIWSTMHATAPIVMGTLVT